VREVVRFLDEAFLAAGFFRPDEVDFFPDDFFAVDFFPDDFFAVDRFDVDLFAVDFFAVDRFDVDFFPVDLFAVDLFAVDLFAVDFFAPDFFAVDLFAVDFFARVPRFDAGLRRPPASAAFSLTVSATSSALSAATSPSRSTTAPITSCAVSVASTFFPARFALVVMDIPVLLLLVRPRAVTQPAEEPTPHQGLRVVVVRGAVVVVHPGDPVVVGAGADHREGLVELDLDLAAVGEADLDLVRGAAVTDLRVDDLAPTHRREGGLGRPIPSRAGERLAVVTDGRDPHAGRDGQHRRGGGTDQRDPRPRPHRSLLTFRGRPSPVRDHRAMPVLTPR
jgi:hypothetical protein